MTRQYNVILIFSVWFDYVVFDLSRVQTELDAHVWPENAFPNAHFFHKNFDREICILNYFLGMSKSTRMD